MAEIDLQIEGLQQDPADNGEDPADILPPLPETAVTKAGDLWLLGRHRVFCGDALDAASYETVLNEEKAAIAFTDPPYNVKIDGPVSGLGSIRHREFAMASGEMSQERFAGFLLRVCTLLARHSQNGAIHFICMDWRHAHELLSAGRDVYSELKNICVWTKHNAGMGSFYRSQHELIFAFKHGRSAHRNNIQLGKYGRNRSNVWNYPGANSFGRGTEEGNLLALHPTVKPVALVADALLDCRAWRNRAGSFPWEWDDRDRC
jgi:DNA modification methylase